MALTTSQQALVKADILASPDLNVQPNSPDGAFAIADLYNLLAVPTFWAWRSSVTIADIYTITTSEATRWNWSTYIGRSVAERDCWRELGNLGTLNFSLLNTRQAVADIFSGTPAIDVAQRTHITTIGRRSTTRLEKLLATGTGTTVSPATMGREGLVSYQDIQQARNS